MSRTIRSIVIVFAVVLGWFPVFGSGDGFTDRLWHLALPAVALALTAMALLLKLTRAAMNFQIDYLARTKLRVLAPDADSLAGKADWQREALVRTALRFDLVREEHLDLLP